MSHNFTFTDIDECENNNGGCQQLHCINSEGSFECGCKEGFKMRDDVNSCTKVMSGSGGKISSGNWPETYPTNIDEQWVIQCGSNQHVTLAFSEGFGLAGALPSCSKDWLKVYDGDSSDAELLGKFCHFAVPQMPKSSSSSLLIHFFAGSSHNPSRRGFELSYICEDVEVEVTVPTTQQLDLQTTSVLPPQPSECGQTLFTESSGTIESPNWPETYPTNLQCEYFIDLPDESSVVEISFNSGFSIAGQYPSCIKDWVKIYDGHTDDTTLHGTYCHFHTPPVTRASGSKAKIVLFAGASHNPSRRGFSASYRTV